MKLHLMNPEVKDAENQVPDIQKLHPSHVHIHLDLC